MKSAGVTDCGGFTSDAANRSATSVKCRAVVNCRLQPPLGCTDFQLELPEPIMQQLYKEAVLMSKIRHLNVSGAGIGLV